MGVAGRRRVRAGEVGEGGTVMGAEGGEAGQAGVGGGKQWGWPGRAL